MNVAGPSAGLDFRRIEPKRFPAKPEPAFQRQVESQTRLSLADDGSRSTASATRLKSSDASAETKASDEADKADEASADESISEDSTEWPDDPGDLVDDREFVDERIADPEDQTEEQRQRKGQRLESLETGYRSRFMRLDGLLDRLTATSDFLTQWLDGRFNKLGVPDILIPRGEHGHPQHP